MALPESAFQKPYWIRYIEGPTLSRDVGAEFDEMRHAYATTREWRSEPQPGYNAQSPSIRKDTIILTVDVPYIRAR
jgi:hypothetical protein